MWIAANSSSLIKYNTQNVCDSTFPISNNLQQTPLINRSMNMKSSSLDDIPANKTMPNLIPPLPNKYISLGTKKNVYVHDKPYQKENKKSESNFLFSTNKIVESIVSSKNLNLPKHKLVLKVHWGVYSNPNQ